MKLTELLRENVVQNQWPISALTGGLKGVIGVDVTANGSGYTGVPTVTPSGGGGSGATFAAVLDTQRVVRVLITATGTGYTSAPTLGFSGGSGSGAAASAIIGPISLDAIPTTQLQTGATVRCEVSGRPMFYKLTAGTDSESSPNVIRPDDYASSTNERVWKLANQDAASAVEAAGSSYAFTTSMALLDFGTTDPSIALPSAGTYLIFGSVAWSPGVNDNDVFEFKFRNSTDGADVGLVHAMSHLMSGEIGAHSMMALTTVSGAKTIQLWGRNSTAARGTADSAGTFIGYIRLF